MTPTPVHGLDNRPPPLISVIIPIFNGAIHIPDFLRCLEIQEFPAAATEFILVDNASSDATPELVAQWRDRMCHLNVQVVEERAIHSSYAARNRGIRAARSNILAFTDVDCRPERSWIGALFRMFDDAGVGLVAGHIQASSGGTLAERYAVSRGVLSPAKAASDALGAYGQTANLALRRQLLESVGLFRPFMDTGGDADLCFRIRKDLGVKLTLCPEAVVVHQNRTTVTALFRQYYRYGRGRRYLEYLHGGSPDMGAAARPIRRRVETYLRSWLGPFARALRQEHWQLEVQYFALDKAVEMSYRAGCATGRLSPRLANIDRLQAPQDWPLARQ